MGAKQGKESKVKWSLKEIDVADESFEPYSEVSLERSTAQDRKQNLIGLPEDVVAMIAVYVAREDFQSMGIVARVCKTWRRISYKDNVWRAIARDRGIDLPAFTRLSVLEEVLFDGSENFKFLPRWVQFALTLPLPDTRKRRKPMMFRIFVSSGNPNHTNVGKSSLTYRFIKNVFYEETDPTVEDDYYKGFGDGKIVKILDAAFYDDYYILEPQYVRCVDVIIIADVFANPTGFDALMYMWNLIRRERDLRENDPMPPVVVVRTKVDLKLPFVRKTEVMQFCRNNKVPFFNSSAKTGANVEKIFTTCIHMINLKRQKERDESIM